MSLTDEQIKKMVEDTAIYENSPWQGHSPIGKDLCCHVKALACEVEDQRREIKARGEIMDAIAKNLGEEGNCWSNAAEIDWRQRLRDFAEDSEQHDIGRQEWKDNWGNGVTLYAHGGFFTAYYDDAAELWGQADDDHPMFHVMVQSDPPHRTVIHPIHLVAWMEHLAEVCMPVQIMGRWDA